MLEAVFFDWNNTLVQLGWVDLERDVQGASRVGMTTIQALWLRAGDTPGIESDLVASPRWTSSTRLDA